MSKHLRDWKRDVPPINHGHNYYAALADYLESPERAAEIRKRDKLQKEQTNLLTKTLRNPK